MALARYEDDDPEIQAQLEAEQAALAQEAQPAAGPEAPLEGSAAGPLDAELPPDIAAEAPSGAIDPDQDQQYQEERAPAPVAAGAGTNTYQPNIESGEVFEPKFSRKLPRISGMLEPSQLYQETPGGGESSLIQAILAALGEEQQ